MICAVDVASVPNGASTWKTLVDAAPQAWFYHTRTNFDFNICAAERLAVVDHSFFIEADGELVGLAPLAFQDLALGEFRGRDASLYSGALPWPCFRSGREDLAELEVFAFDELERRARGAGVARIRFLFAPLELEAQRERLAAIVLSRRYLATAHQSHRITLAADTLSNVRERYRRYHRKYSPLFDLKIVEGADLTAEWEQAYFELHVKDAGGQFRSRESYARQANLARCGEGFYVAALSKQAGRPAGMLLVSLFKNAAYDNSVAVDPEFQESYVSHLLKWRAIEELIRRSARTYELGERAELPALARIPSTKQRGITYFKEGWARGETIYRCGIEKIFDRQLLVAQARSWEGQLAKYYDISERLSEAGAAQ